jgi:5-formyltetrahydrofolate cyclo-ligase
MISSPLDATKTGLRRQLRAARASVTAETRRKAATLIVRLALRAGWLRQGRRIGFYMPAKGELDITELLTRAMAMRVNCFLPVVPQARQRTLGFTRMTGRADWTHNRYGIPEHAVWRPKIRARRLDILFLPLLGFDQQGYRMGMGGGYYDASLAFLRHRKCWQRPYLIGIAFEAQRLTALPVDPWDVPLDAVLTERQIYRFRPPRART